jgi:hypothetical protein
MVQKFSLFSFLQSTFQALPAGYPHLRCNFQKTKMESKSTTDQKLTEDEAKLYDRQIRLWGVDGQQR